MREFYRRYIEKIFYQYKSFLLYVFFGGCTTVINVAAYAGCTRLLHLETVPSNIAAWVVAVTWAYVTNKIWVFESRSWDMRELLREIISFVVCRVATGALDLAVMYVTVDVLRWPDILMKLVANGLVIVLNFIFSKLVIFRKRESETSGK